MLPITVSTSGPAEGLAWKPGRSGNAVFWDGTAVIKRHAAGAAALLRELEVLARVADLPGPRVLPGTTPTALRMTFVEGVTAIAAIETGQASDVLRAMGESLRAIQQVSPRRFGVDIGTVIHGDFAPYNVIVSDDGAVVRAVLDWEAADVGDPLTDLAWCESQFLRLFPRHAYALPHLFSGYGATLARSALDASLAARLSQLRRVAAPARMLSSPYRSIEVPDRTEAAAFIAAVSRAASAPLRAAPHESPAQIWIRARADARPRVLLNDAAATVAAASFHAPLMPDELGPDDRLAFLAGHVAPLGLADALALL